MYILEPKLGVTHVQFVMDLVRNHNENASVCKILFPSSKTPSVAVINVIFLRPRASLFSVKWHIICYLCIYFAQFILILNCIVSCTPVTPELHSEFCWLILLSCKLPYPFTAPCWFSHYAAVCAAVVHCKRYRVYTWHIKSELHCRSSAKMVNWLGWKSMLYL